jgi:tyrosine-protein kinase Etk/Wzc
MSIQTSPSDPKVQSNSPPFPPVPGKVADEDDEISLLDILIILADRKRIVLLLTGGFTLLAIIVSFVLPKRYTATVTLLTPQQNSSLGAALSSQLGNLGGVAALAGGSLGLKSPNETFIAMLRSRTVEDAMVQHFGLMQEYHQRYPSDARKAFEKHATVDGSSKDGLIHISVEDGDPGRAAELANGYIDQFRNLSEHLAITEASQRRLFFEEQLQQAKSKLADAEEALKKTEQSTGLIELSGQARALIESAASLRAQIAAKEVQIQSLGTFATSENSQLVQAQQELASLRAQLAKLGGSQDSVDSGLLVPKGRVPQAGLEYMRKLRDVRYQETIFEILARQFEAAKLDEARQGALIQVVDAAVPPDKSSFPKRGLIVVGAATMGFIIGVLVVLSEATFRKMRSTPETDQKLNLLHKSLFRQRRSV